MDLIEKLKYVSLTDIGHREVNQDYIKIFNNKYYKIFIIADGCGGHEGSEIAAKYLLDGINIYSTENNNLIVKYTKDSIFKLISFAIDYMSEKLSEYSCEDAATTIAMVFINKFHTIYCHIGDSRIYRISKKNRVWHTKDHAVKNSNILTRSVSFYSKPNPEIKIGKKIEKGETIIICSDGFWEYLNRDILIKIHCSNFIEKKDIIKNYILNIKKENSEIDNISCIIISTD